MPLTWIRDMVKEGTERKKGVFFPDEWREREELFYAGLMKKGKRRSTQ